MVTLHRRRKQKLDVQSESEEFGGDIVLRLPIKEWGMLGRHQVILTNQRVGNVGETSGYADQPESGQCGGDIRLC